MTKEEALNTLAKVFHNGAVMVVDLALWNEGCEAIEALIGGEEDTGECSSCKHASTVTVGPCVRCIDEVEIYRNYSPLGGAMNPALVAEMPKPRDEEIEELKRQKDALMEELENIATAEWREFDPDTRRCAYEFVLWAQSRARHTINRVLSGDVTKPLPEDVSTGMRKELIKSLRKMSAENKSPRDCIDDAADEIERLRNIEDAAVACSAHPVWNDDQFYGLMVELARVLRNE